jgi:hypothetical protein
LPVSPPLITSCIDGFGLAHSELVSISLEPAVPFRWNLLRPDNVGTVLDGVDPPQLWFIHDLITCAGNVLARSGGGDLIFVGRSLDSMFDLLGGALEDTAWSHRLHRLPLSFTISGQLVGGHWRPGQITHAQRERAREILANLALDPHALARRSRPATFVDVVHAGSTFTKLYGLLRAWINDNREPWNVIRRKLRFVGVTSRTKTSPNTFRWQQAADWTRDLPARAVLNVSLDPVVWSYFGDVQMKLNRSFRPADWLAEPDGPQRGEHTRKALAEALAIVEHGRTRQTRKALARVMSDEPSVAQPWLRALVVQLSTRC